MNNPKEIWRTLKSLGMPSQWRRMSLEENGVVYFDSKKMQIYFVGFPLT